MSTCDLDQALLIAQSAVDSVKIQLVWLRELGRYRACAQMAGTSPRELEVGRNQDDGKENYALGNDGLEQSAGLLFARQVVRNFETGSPICAQYHSLDCGKSFEPDVEALAQFHTECCWRRNLQPRHSPGLWRPTHLAH